MKTDSTDSPPSTEETPTHIAIIMDGNGRWAQDRGLPRIEGHRRGSAAVEEVANGCRDLGVRFLTLFAFSSENWNRPKSETNALMRLLEEFLREKRATLKEQGVRLRAIGNLDDLPAGCRKQLDLAMQETEAFDRFQLVLALSYGGRAELVEVARRLARDVREGRLDPEAIDEATFSARLFTAGIPDPDLLIRTSGEMRLSNFLLWQMSYTEIIIAKKYWPDFKKEDLIEAAREFGRRRRRFGRV